MPTYQYRCQSCHREHMIVHGMLEEMTVVCPDCGHFCQKIMSSSPVILSSSVPPMEPDAETPAHECGTSCVLHQPPQQAKQASKAKESSP